METLLQGQKLDEEIAAVKRHLQALSQQKLKLQNHHVSPQEERPRRVAVPQIPLAEPPAIIEMGVEPASSASISLTLKSVKPALTFALSCPPTASIAELKALLVSSYPDTAPPFEAQRWVFKGKALADAKVLREYDAIKEGETVHLMIKATMATPSAPGSTSPAREKSPTVPPVPMVSLPPPTSYPPTPLTMTAKEKSHGGHKSRPSLSTSIPKITMDASDPSSLDQPFSSSRPHSRSASVSSAHSPHFGVSEGFRSVATDPDFWFGVKEFLGARFANGLTTGEENVRLMWEHWFSASKEFMTASDIAKIREAAGISGMAGR